MWRSIRQSTLLPRRILPSLPLASSTSPSSSLLSLRPAAPFPISPSSPLSSRLEGAAHADPVLPHPVPSPHGPPPSLPSSTRRVEEPEKLKERGAVREQKASVHNEEVREAREMVQLVEARAAVGEEEKARLAERMREQVLREREEIERRLHREEEERRKRQAEVERMAAGRARLEAKAQAEREQKEAVERRRSEAAVKQRVEQATAEQRAMADGRRAEQQRQEQLRQQAERQAERTAKLDAERVVRSRREEELSAKQEKERQERARWMAEQQRTRAASTPPPSSSSTLPSAASSLSASVRHPSEEMRRLEEETIRKATEQEQQAQRKERILVQEERERLARSAEHEQAQRQRAAAAAEADKKRAEEQRRADAKREEEEQRKREEAAKAAAVEAEQQRKRGEEITRLQQRQQEELIRSLQQKAAAAPPPTAPTSAPLASVFVINPGTPPPRPPGGPGEGGSVVVATPAHPEVKTNLAPEQPSSRTPSWLPYALIALGGGLMALYISRKRQVEPTKVVVTTVRETWLPAADGGADEVVEEVVWSVALPEVQRPQLRRAAEPPQLLPLTPPPPIPDVSEEDLAQLLPATPVTTSTAADSSSADSPQLLEQVMQHLEGFHLQQLLSSLSDLHTEEANHLRDRLRSALTQQLQQLTERVKELTSGVEVSVAAPLLSLHDQQTSGQEQSSDELRAYLASLHRQHEFLTQAHSPAPAVTGDTSDSSQASPPSSSSSSSSPAAPPSASSPSSASLVSFNAERARGEVERQMTASFAELLRELEQQAEQIVQQVVELEKSTASSLTQRRLQQTLEQRVHETVEEERQRWQDVEQRELRQLRDDQLAITRMNLQMQRQQLDQANDEERRRRMEEVDGLAGRLRSFLSAFQGVVDETKDSDQLHRVALAALALDSLSREEEVEKEEETGRQRVVSPEAAQSSGLLAEWRRLWRLRSSDEVIDAAVSSIPSHVLTSGLPSVPQLRRRWRRVQAALKEEAFVPKAAEQDGLGRSPWAQLVGKLFSLLYLSPASVAAEGVVGETGEVGVIDRMNAMVGEKKWGEVLRLEGELSPTCRALCEGWVQQVEDRLVVEQALQAVKARVICLSCAYDT